MAGRKELERILEKEYGIVGYQQLRKAISDLPPVDISSFCINMMEENKNDGIQKMA